MGWFTKIFGFDGVLKVEGITMDNQIFTAKVPVSCFNVNNAEALNVIKKAIKQQYNIEMKTLQIIGDMQKERLLGK